MRAQSSCPSLQIYYNLRGNIAKERGLRVDDFGNNQYSNVRQYRNVCLYEYYNYMIKISTLLFCLLAFILHSTLSYRILAGRRKIIPPQLDLAHTANPVQPVIKSHLRMLLFPYHIYEYQPHANMPYSRAYVLLKINYTDFYPLLLPTPPSDSLPEQQTLYDHLPEVILIEPTHNEYLQLSLLSQSLDCRQFVLKNSTTGAEENGSRIFDLNFYSLQLHKYLFRVMKVAEYKTADNETAANLQQSQMSPALQNLTNAMKQLNKLKFIIQKILPNDTYWQGEDFTHVLIQKLLTRNITEHTKWKAYYDGFSLNYFSAVITNTKPLPRQPSSDQLELVNLVIQSGEEKLSKIIKQPMKFMKLTSVEFLDVCSTGEVSTLLLSDKIRAYVIDITKEDWHLLKYVKTSSSQLHYAFFGRECRAYGLHLQTRKSTNSSQEDKGIAHIIEYYPKNQKKYTIDKPVDHYFHLNADYLIFCQKNNSCSLIDTSTFKQADNQFLNQTLLTITKEEEVHLRVQLQQSNMTALIQVMNYQKQTQQLYPLNFKNLIIKDAKKTDSTADSKAISISNDSITKTTITITPTVTSSNHTSKNHNTTTDNNKTLSSALQYTIYDSQTYSNRTRYISREMDRTVYEHLQSSHLLSPVLQTLIHDELFDNPHLQSKCITQGEFQSSQVQIKYNQTQQWLVCAMEIQVKMYLQLLLQFKEKYLNYQMYLCQSFIEQRYNDRIDIDCTPLFQRITDLLEATTLDQTLPLTTSTYYKLYLVKQTDQPAKHLPAVLLKDVQRQQIELASTVFFVIMIILSLVLLSLILFLALRSILISVFIYYGWMHEQYEPTYPLAWFPLKTKLKRMQQAGILSFVEYEPSISDTEGNHCCFCLEIIHDKTVVAQIYCGHEFHKECFRQWIKNQPNAKCPTCRRPFTRNGLLEFQSGAGSNQDLPF